VSISLFPLDPAAPIKICDFSRNDTILIFELCGAPFHDEVGEESAETAQHYATVARRALKEGELEGICEREGEEDVDGVREIVEEYIKFCEQCGGYRVWA
jgi:hypothetical protein